MTYIIRTPNPDFEGIRAGLIFRRGQAQTEDQAAAEYCRDILGYQIEQLDITGGIVEPQRPPRPPKRRDE